VLKEVLISKRKKGGLERSAQERDTTQPAPSTKEKTVSVDKLEEPERI